MKFFDKTPTIENVLDSFQNNTTGRDEDVLAFLSLLNSIDSSSSIAIDGQWGAGKTFFIKQVKMILDAYNPHTKTYDEEFIENVKMTVMAFSKLELQPFVTVYYDAWANDNDDDPILSLVYSVLKSCDADLAFVENHEILNIVSNIAEAVSGKPIGNILSALKGKDLLESIREKKSVEALVYEFLESLLPERGNRLIIFVDELDRCNPNYAVKFLERIKHYFLDDRITFVFSVNLAELQHTIKHHYGEGFNAFRYLDRFFDFRVDLPPASMDYYYKSLGLDHKGLYFGKVCSAVAKHYNFSLREISRFYRAVKTSVYAPVQHGSNYFSDGIEDLLLYYMIPIIIGLKYHSHTKYVAFLRGEDISPLIEFHKNNNHLGDRIYRKIVPINFEEARKTTFEEFLKGLYHALFCYSFSDNRSIDVYGFTIYEEESKRFVKIINAFSEYADYEI